MRIARKLLLLGVIAAAAMAMSASPASAISVVTESTGAGCGTAGMTTGGCTLHASGQVQLSGHLFGFESVDSNCKLEFKGRTGEPGEGFVDHATFTDVTKDSCTRIPCKSHDGSEGEPLEWPVHLESTVNGLVLHVEFCIMNKDHSDQKECQFNNIPVTEVGHTYGINFNDQTQDANHENCSIAELDGGVTLEGTAIEIK